MIVGSKVNRPEDEEFPPELEEESPFGWEDEFWDAFSPDDDEPLPEPDDFWIEPDEDSRPSIPLAKLSWLV